jgi:hypothetical protein
MRALELRRIVRMLEVGDQVVDHLLAQFTDDPVRAYTGDQALARTWSRKIAPELHINLRPIGVRWSVEAHVQDKPVPCWFIAYEPAVVICYAGLNRLVDRLDCLLTLTENPSR